MASGIYTVFLDGTKSWRLHQMFYINGTLALCVSFKKKQLLDFINSEEEDFSYINFPLNESFFS